MPSSPKISRETILKAALDILIRDGYGAVNIKAIAQEIGCSTQPISRQFGSMEGLRSALTDATMDYVRQKKTAQADNPLATFALTGYTHVDLAMDEPNLFRFIFMGGSDRGVEAGFAALFSYDRDSQLVAQLAQTLNLTSEQVVLLMSVMVTYTHGVASMIAGGVVKEKKETAHAMIRDAGLLFLQGLGVERELTEALMT